MRYFTRLILPVFAASLILATAAQAQTAKKPKKPAAPAAKSQTLSQAITQVDGITNEVVDKLWEGTDEYWHHGDYYRIVSILRVCVEADPVFTDAYGNGAWLLWSLGDTLGADRFLKYGIARKPQLWDLEYEFGRHLYTTKRYSDALPYLKRATANPKADALAWKTLAHTYDRMGRFKESADAWRTVVKRFPKDVAGPSNLKRVEAKIKG
jgi:tetratricopeptide (TPR) repeat protein